MGKNQLIVVCGAGGFIGGHLIADLRRQGCTNLRAVDIKPFPQFGPWTNTLRRLRMDTSSRSSHYQLYQAA